MTFIAFRRAKAVALSHAAAFEAAVADLVGAGIPAEFIAMPREKSTVPFAFTNNGKAGSAGSSDIGVVGAASTYRGVMGCGQSTKSCDAGVVSEAAVC
jgi:hypothetical protein